MIEVEKFTKTVFQEKLMKYGPLPIRVLTGIIFIAHGIAKLVNLPWTRHFFSHALAFPHVLVLNNSAGVFHLMPHTV
jgi:uncharacterized membrane protein YphA (DoxX/SURF4 family)